MSQKYIGISPYDEDEQFEFVGRTEETWALYDRISRNDYTVYYAASGEGKSSLIKAGLLPILRRRDYFPVYIVFEDKELRDISMISKVVLTRIKSEIEKRKASYEEIVWEQSDWSKSYFSKEQSQMFEKSLWWKLRNYCFKKKNGTELKPLLIFDQFEEVFTKANYVWTDAFFGWLEEISTDYVPESLSTVNTLGSEIPTQKNFKALFSFRTEYLGDLDYWCVQKHFLPSLQENRMCLKPLTPKGAMEVINLNKEVLAPYTDKIISGCVEPGSKTDNQELPCVYALVLSVVCKTLSEASEKEKSTFLENLNNNQSAIDDILFKFYTEKLKEAGLDYVKDIEIISAIEDALVNENGKRSRRETEEPMMQPIAKWIKQLCKKENGLIKIIGSNMLKDKVVYTVEFPHDRLCNAINIARKERQNRVAEKVTRQKEWMQFGIISIVFGFVAYIISNSLNEISIIKSLISILYNNNKLLEVFKTFCFENSNSFNDFILSSIPLYRPKIISINFAEQFSTAFLVLFLLIFTPVLTILFSYNRNKKTSIFALSLSAISTIVFGLLLLKNIYINFEQGYAPTITFMGCIISFILLIYFYRRSYSKRIRNNYVNNNSLSLWPLWGGIIIIAIYIFYLTLTDLSFGISEPIDSFWGVFVLPLFYTLFIRDFFHVETKVKSKQFRLLVFGLISLLLFVVFFYFSNISQYISLWQEYGILLTVILFSIYFGTFIYSLWSAKTNNRYYVLSKTKIVFMLQGCMIASLLSFFLSLGYNPFKIPLGAVVKVYSWRTVLAKSDINGKTKFGVLSAQGDTIIPYIINFGNNDTLSSYKINDFMRNGQVKVQIKKKCHKLLSSVFSNSDSSLVWSNKDSISASIITTPTLEEHLYRKVSENLSSNATLEDSIDYYSSKLFVEIRNANIKWLLTGEDYNIRSLPSLSILQESQQKALNKSIHRFIERKDSLQGEQREIDLIMEDQDLVDLQCSLVRSFILCMLEDRCRHQDMLELFSLHSEYLFAFFPYLQNVSSVKKFTVNSETISICSDDIYNKKAFAWYYFFNGLCALDEMYNNDLLKMTYDICLDPKKLLDECMKVKKLNDDYSKVSDFIDNYRKGKNNKSNIFDIAKVYLKMRTPDYYQSMKSELGFDAIIPQYIRANEQFDIFKESVITQILPILEKRPYGLYNNCLEQICRNILKVSAFRGYDVEKEVNRINAYTANKDSIYIQLNALIDQKKTTSKFLKLHKESQANLDSIIRYLQK